MLFVSAQVYAERFSVGGKIVDVPAPKGFVKVTPEMESVYRLSRQMIDPYNDVLALYISESDIPAALSGKIPYLRRYFYLKVNKKIKNIILGTKEFAEIKNITKQQNKQLLQSLKAKVSDILKKSSRKVSREFDIDFAVQLSEVVPLDPHFETDNALAYSMFLKYNANMAGVGDNFIIAATVMYVNAAGKILLLYCYAPKDELEWTRTSTKAWAERIMAVNDKPPVYLPRSRGFNWNRLLHNIIIGGLAGCIIALISGLIKKMRKKSES
jgi:hypothetical protein